jgi:hypothetical protein
VGGTDLLLDRMMTTEELRPVVAALLHVSPETIYIPNDTYEARFSAESPSAVTIVRTTYTADFPLGLGIYAASDLPNPEDPAFVRAFCRRLHCRALIEAVTPPTDRDADSIFWLVTPAGDIYRVVVEDDLLDNEPPGFRIDLRQGMQPVHWPLVSANNPGFQS